MSFSYNRFIKNEPRNVSSLFGGQSYKEEDFIESGLDQGDQDESNEGEAQTYDDNRLHCEELLTLMLYSGMEDEDILNCCEMLGVDEDHLSPEQMEFVKDVFYVNKDLDENSGVKLPSPQYVISQVQNFHAQNMQLDGMSAGNGIFTSQRLQ